MMSEPCKRLFILRYFIAQIFIGRLIFFAACGGGGAIIGGAATEEVEPPPEIRTLEQLPKASAGVVAVEEDSDDSDSETSGSSDDSEWLMANTGLGLEDASDADFSRDSSFAMCQATEDLRSALSEAAMGDKVLCYLQNTLPSYYREGLDIYDGGANLFTIDFPSEDDTDILVQVRIKRIAGLIQKFEMWSCENGLQTAYLTQSISGNTFTMASIYKHDNGAQRMTVTGTLDRDGNFVGKEINSKFDFSWDEGEVFGEKTVVFTSETATISKWDSGEWQEDGSTNSFENTVSSFMEILGSGSLSSIALGDGASRGSSSGSIRGSSYAETFVEGWNGDTMSRDITSDFITDVENIPPPEAGSATSFTFTGDESVDCFGSGYRVTVNPVELSIACSEYDYDGGWLNCWDVVKNGVGGGNEALENSLGEECATFTDCADLGSSAICMTSSVGRVCNILCDTDAECAVYGDYTCGTDSVCTGFEDD